MPADLARELERVAGKLTADALSEHIARTVGDTSASEGGAVYRAEKAHPLLLAKEAYDLLRATFPNAVNDTQLVRMCLTPAGPIGNLRPSNGLVCAT